MERMLAAVMSLQNIESAEWKRYNANTRDARVGDCVKRALSVAYSVDYDEVSKELNRIKRKLGYDVYNISPVYSKFIEARGNHFVVVNPDKFPSVESYDKVKVSDVCDTYPVGTYILEVGEKPGRGSSHLCTVVDGVLFDSWDSRDWYVKRWCTVTDAATEVYDIRYEDIIDDIDAYLIEYLSRLESKNSDLLSGIDLTTSEHVDRYTYEQVMVLRFKEYPPHDSDYDRSKSWGHTFTVKLNPRMDADTNTKILKKKIAQKMYDWSYNVLKDVRDAIAASEFDWSESSGRFYYDERKFVMNLPPWSRKLITDINIDQNMRWQMSKYEVSMKALPDDPYIKTRGDEVTFYADTLKELKDQMAYYKEDFARFNYEY